MDALRALIVDDEPLARDVLRSLLEEEPDVVVVGECGSGAEAVKAARRERPDLLFLDVEMPELDGFGVVRALDAGPEPRFEPVVIFVTAHDRYALRAFEVHAFDYLLKPFDRDRLRASLERARTARAAGPAGAVGASGGSLDARLLALLEHLGASHTRRLTVRSADRALLLRTEAIDWLEAAGKYVRVHVGHDVHQLREAIGHLEQRLDPEQFVRISRSAIVNIDRIREIQPWFQGEYVVLLRDGTRLTSTRGHRDNLLRLLGR